MEKRGPTIRQFEAQFPTEEACLEHLMRTRYGDRHECAGCHKSAHYYRVSTRRAYVCEYCGHQVYPTAGTPFDRTRTPLRDWFFVIYLLCASRNGVAAKEVQRQLGVTYKTAWRMCHMIREYMGELAGSGPIGGPSKTVEIDETFIGGKVTGGQGGKGKSIVMGMYERGGDIILKAMPDRTSGTLLTEIHATVRKQTDIHTDMWLGYGGLPTMGYTHGTVNHKKGEHVSPLSGASVNALEGYWAQLKRGINGTHIYVSAKHLPKYLGEFSYRWNMRRHQHLMVDRLMSSFAR